MTAGVQMASDENYREYKTKYQSQFFTTITVVSRARVIVHHVSTIHSVPNQSHSDAWLPNPPLRRFAHQFVYTQSVCRLD